MINDRQRYPLVLNDYIKCSYLKNKKRTYTEIQLQKRNLAS